MRNKKRIVFIILTIIWMVTIFIFSNQNSDTSSDTSGNVIRTVVRLFTNVSQEQEEIIIEQLQHFVRKMAHFSIYALGGIILMNLVKTYTDKCAWLYAWIIGTVYAITDEIHQYFIPGRSNQISDVVIDSSGVITGVLIVIIVGYAIKKVKTKYFLSKNIEK